MYSPRLDEALVFAAEAFRSHTRKGSQTPYLAHLLQVMVTVAEGGGDEDQMIAAVLHDYLEDVEGAKREHLVVRFGIRVANFVEEMSDAIGRPKPAWEARKAEFIFNIRGAAPDLKLICASDKLHNARSILRDLDLVGPAVWDRFAVTKDQTLGYYRGVTDALADGWDHWVLGELSAVVDQLEAAGR